MKRLLISLSITFAAIAIIYCALGIAALDIYVETAFVIVVYPLLAAGITKAFVLLWRSRHGAR